MNSKQWNSLYIMRPPGMIVERVQIGTDGSFTYSHGLEPGDYVIVTSDGPLTVLPLPTPGVDGVLRIFVPSVAARDIVVELGEMFPQTDARIGLSVSNMYVPESVMTEHQQWRRLQPALYNRRMLIRDILFLGPVGIILGPSPTDSNTGAIDDIMIRPEFAATFPRKDATGGHVRFD